jgi:TPR repeat protein
MDKVMSKGWISHLLGLRAEELSSSAAQESASELRLPTLDERVSLYSRAMREQHDLRGEPFSNVRGRILDAMAADIAMKAGIPLPKELEHPGLPQDANLGESGWQPDLLEDRLLYAPASARPLPSKPLELNAPFEHSADYARAHAYSDTYARLAHASAALEFEDDVAVAQKVESRRRPALKLAMLAASLSAVVIGGSMALLLSRNSNFPTDWSGMGQKSDKLDVAVQSLQKPSEAQLQAAVQSLQKPSVPQFQAMQNESTAVASVGTSAVMSPSANQVDFPPSTNQPRPEEIADLVKRGRELFAAGKIRDARILLKRAAEAGDATAALALATTYDPAELEKLEARDADPDLTEARAWYQKAKDLGSTSAGGIPQNSGR